MAEKRDLIVNDLARYEKSSERLVLEDYSSCEVPAGCGGGILRWIDPAEALPLTLRLWTTGEAEVFFDGAATRSARVDARPGDHVLAVLVTPKGAAPPQIALSLCYSDETKRQGGGPYRSRPIGQRVDIVSGAGARVVGTSQEPAGDAWKQTRFDAAGWAALTAVQPHHEDPTPWQLSELLKQNAQVLGRAGASGRLWVRCAFDIALGEAR